MWELTEHPVLTLSFSITANLVSGNYFPLDLPCTSQEMKKWRQLFRHDRPTGWRGSRPWWVGTHLSHSSYLQLQKLTWTCRFSDSFCFPLEQLSFVCFFAFILKSKLTVPFPSVLNFILLDSVCHKLLPRKSHLDSFRLQLPSLTSRQNLALTAACTHRTRSTPQAPPYLKEHPISFTCYLLTGSSWRSGTDTCVFASLGLRAK